MFSAFFLSSSNTKPLAICSIPARELLSARYLPNRYYHTGWSSTKWAIQFYFIKSGSFFKILSLLWYRGETKMYVSRMCWLSTFTVDMRKCCVTAVTAVWIGLHIVLYWARQNAEKHAIFKTKSPIFLQTLGPSTTQWIPFNIFSKSRTWLGTSWMNVFCCQKAVLWPFENIGPLAECKVIEKYKLQHTKAHKMQG